MKKVLALMLAVLMLATVAFAARPVGDTTPGSKIKISKEGIKDEDNVEIYIETEDGRGLDGKPGKIKVGNGTGDEDISKYILRSVTSDNYSVTNVKIQKVGKSLVEGVRINDAEDRVEVILKDDLNNTSSKDFEVTFKLKGKVKFTVRDSGEAKEYNAQVPTNKKLKDDAGKCEEKDAPNYLQMVGKKVSLPDLDFTVVGSVGYGKVEVSVGDDGDEELENLEDLMLYTKKDGTGPQGNADHIDIENDIIKFVTGPSGTAGNAVRTAGPKRPVAGSYTADAILTQEYGDALTLEARVYKNDVLYFYCDNDPDRDIIGRLADSDADMDFYVFNSDTKFTTFNSNAKLYFNDAEEDDFVYQIKDKKLVKVGEFSEDDGCWVVKTRTLGAYVVSDVELTEFEAAAGTVDGNPDTGANDVVGIATALAAVALVSAAAVSLKK